MLAVGLGSYLFHKMDERSKGVPSLKETTLVKKLDN
jgi:hypothetical protein